jgi:succinyl-CoA synthetase beta subunit
MLTKRSSRDFVIAAAQPAAKALAADGPGFPVTIDQDIGKRGAGGGVKQVITPHYVAEHVERSLD